MKKKNVLMMAMSLVLVAVIAVGGTLAYLTATPQELTNTFAVGSGYEDDDPTNPALKLDETAKVDGNPTVISDNDRTSEDITYDAMYPGSIIAKDPTLRLKNGSPVSYLFAKVDGVDALTGVKAKINDNDSVDAFIVSNEIATDVVKAGENVTESALSNSWVKIADIDEDGNPVYTVEDGEIRFTNTATKLDGIYRLMKNGGVVTVPAKDESAPNAYTAFAPLFKSVVMRSDLVEMPTLDEDVNNINITGYAIQEDNMDNAEAALTALFNITAE